MQLRLQVREGSQLNVVNCVKRVGIVHTSGLTESRIFWRGWHAFRRGLATNLYRLGVQDKTIQAILRHAALATTMNIYVKQVPEESVKAMKALETSVRLILVTSHGLSRRFLY